MTKNESLRLDYRAGDVSRRVCGQREPAPVEEVKPAPEQPAEPQQPVPTVPSVPTIPQQPCPIEHEDQTHRLRRIFAIMTGMAQCSRWSVRCLGPTG